MSVFLPTWYHREATYVAESRSISGRLLHETRASKFDEVNKDEKTRTSFVKSVDNEITKLLPLSLLGQLPLAYFRTVEQELAGIIKAKDDFKTASDDAGRKKSFAELRAAATKLNSTSLFKDLYQANLKTVVTEIDNEFKVQLVDEGKNGWSRFQRAVRYKAK